MFTRKGLYLLLLVCTGGQLLAGCGGGVKMDNGSPNSFSAKGSIADLRGGWLVAGSMPNGIFPSGGPLVFGLTLNLDIVSGQVTGFGSIQLPCGNNGAFSGAVGGGLRLAPATVAADGTFTLNDALTPGTTQHAITVQGSLPDAAGGVWSGTFTASAPLSTCNGMAVPTQTGTYTTQRIADLDGTFVGSGTLNGSQLPLNLTAALTQGGPASINNVSSELNDQSAVNGSLQVQGVSCFKNGTVKLLQSVPEGALFGNRLQMEFLMDDGSTVLLNGTESNLGVSTLTGVSLLVVGGACDQTSALLTTVAKQ